AVSVTRLRAQIEPSKLFHSGAQASQKVRLGTGFHCRRSLACHGSWPGLSPVRERHHSPHVSPKRRTASVGFLRYNSVISASSAPPPARNASSLIHARIGVPPQLSSMAPIGTFSEARSSLTMK